jgi:endonuclease YncB( thermonuclease family)
MAFRIRKSFRIAPGVRINLNAKSASVRLGPKSLGYTVSSNGGKRLSAAIPGTGLQYSQSISPKPLPVNLTARQMAHGGRWRPGGWTLLGALAIVLAIGGFSVQSDQEISGSISAPRAGIQPTSTQPKGGVAVDSKVGLYTTAGVRLRQGPSVDSPVVLIVPAGTLVRPSQMSGLWHYISVGENSGWIHGDYLKSDAPIETASRGASTHPEAAYNSISGRASIIDGDTVEIAGTRVRFNGIDAPESAQLCQDAKGRNYRCGQVAAKALDAWLAKARPLTCSFVEWDRYRRFVGDCLRADGQSVAAWLVVNGHAMDWPRHSSGAYDEQQKAARGAKSGIWQGRFQAPWEWRAQQAGSEVVAQPSRLMSATCNIKGNISKSGERIYHVPGQRFYSQTAISAGRGERMFCSEADARAAGWRRSKR